MSLIRKLEKATNIRATIGPHLFKLDPHENISDNTPAVEFDNAQLAKKQTIRLEPKRIPAFIFPDAKPQEKAVNVKGIT